MLHRSRQGILVAAVIGRSFTLLLVVARLVLREIAHRNGGIAGGYSNVTTERAHVGAGPDVPDGS